MSKAQSKRQDNWLIKIFRGKQHRSVDGSKKYKKLPKDLQNLNRSYGDLVRELGKR